LLRLGNYEVLQLIAATRVSVQFPCGKSGVISGQDFIHKDRLKRRQVSLESSHIPAENLGEWDLVAGRESPQFFCEKRVKLIKAFNYRIKPIICFVVENIQSDEQVLNYAKCYQQICCLSCFYVMSSIIAQEADRMQAFGMLV